MSPAERAERPLPPDVLQLFRRYLAQEKRSIKALAAETGEPWPRVKRLAVEYGWAARAREFDSRAQEATLEADLDTLVEIRAQQIKSIRQAQAGALLAMTKDKLKDLKPAAAVYAFKELLLLDRLLMGESTSNTQSHEDSLGELE